MKTALNNKAEPQSVKRYEVQCTCLVEASTSKEAQEMLLAKLAYLRRTLPLGAPLGATVGKAEHVINSKLPIFDLVVPKPKTEEPKAQSSATDKLKSKTQSEKKLCVLRKQSK